MESDAISVSNVSKHFKTYKSKEEGFMSFLRREKYTKKALNGISFNIKKGEIVALLGKNGSGKSTLIKIITGIVYPDKGSACVLGVDSWKDRTKASQHIGVVLGAHGQLFMNLPPLDTFNYIKNLYDVPEKEFKKRLDYFVNALELQDVYTRQVRTLSLGEQMKCNFVASMLHMPDIVILDEPTIGVDIPSKSALKNTILDMNKRYNTTFLLTTHIVEDISVVRRIIMLDNGKVIFDGSRSKLETFFGNLRTVELTLNVSPKEMKLQQYGKVLETDTGYAKLEVRKEMLKTKKFITLLETNAVADYSVSEPGLSSIISKFYTKSSKPAKNDTGEI